MTTRNLVLAALLATAPLAAAATLDAPAESILPGTACPGCEGEWNCLGYAYQRCASGLWSAVRPLACGTACTPAGRSYDFALMPDPGNDAASVCSPATTAAPTTAPSTNSSYTSRMPSSSSAPGAFTSDSAASPLGPASLAQHGRNRMAAAVVGIGTAAVVFARLLM